MTEEQTDQTEEKGIHITFKGWLFVSLCLEKAVMEQSQFEQWWQSLVAAAESKSTGAGFTTGNASVFDLPGGGLFVKVTPMPPTP